MTRSFSTALKTPPEIRGILVLSDISFIIRSISSLFNVKEDDCIFPALFTIKFFSGPEDSILKTLGSLKIVFIFPKLMSLSFSFKLVDGVLCCRYLGDLIGSFSGGLLNWGLIIGC